MHTTMATNDDNLFTHEFNVLRALLVAPAAFLVTALLIWGMERLIHAESVEMPAVSDYEMINPVLDQREPDPVEYFKPIPPAPVDEAPEIPEIDVTVDTSGNGMNIEPVKIDRGLGGKKAMSFSSDTPIATMMMQPDYPARAVAQGIEGYVDVQFDVAPTGATTNIMVVGAEPEKIFNRAAIKAVTRWKFNPAEKDGKPIVFAGLVQRITFQLAQQ